MNIHENNTDHLGAFIHLNEQWIAHYFELEASDRALAANPVGVIERGGYIFSLEVAGEVVGVCALFNEGEGRYELARMAVNPGSQGKGYGDVLMETALAKLRAIGAKEVHLLSNTVLEAAISLYRKHGFDTISTEQHPVYKRCNIVLAQWIS